MNYHHTLCNIPEELGSHLLRGGSLKSHIAKSCCMLIQDFKYTQSQVGSKNGSDNFTSTKIFFLA